MKEFDDRKIDVSIVIVSYNTCNVLRDCLRSVEEKTQGVGYEVVVVDNASKDGSREMVQEEFPWVKLVASLENLGFLVEEFQRVSSQKAMAAYDRRTGNLRKVRRQVDAAFRELATVINALYCVNHYIERNAEKEKALAEVINQVNAVLRDASKTLVRKGLAYVPVSQRKEKTDSAESES